MQIILTRSTLVGLGLGFYPVGFTGKAVKLPGVTDTVSFLNLNKELQAHIVILLLIISMRVLLFNQILVIQGPCLKHVW